MKLDYFKALAVAVTAPFFCSCADSFVLDSQIDETRASDASDCVELFASVNGGFSAVSGNVSAIADNRTKTVLNDDWTVSWCAGDGMSVFNAGAGEKASFSSNCRFLISDVASGKFVKDASETSKSLVEGKDVYDWYACSPWMQYGAAPFGTKGYTINRSPQQVGYGSAAHVSESDIMAGKSMSVPSGQAPVLKLNHVCALMKFTVVNNSGSAATINGLTLDATAGGSYITGSFTMDWGDDASELPRLDASKMGSAKAYTCALSVVENVGTESAPEYSAITKTVADGEAVDLYMVVAPFSIPAGGSLKLEISGSEGICTLEKTMSGDISFGAGSYNTATISYSKPEKILFTENFGTKAVGAPNINQSLYDKSGLSTLYPDDAANYSYGVGENASLQTAAYTYTVQTTSGAYVRFPKANSMLAIKGIALHGSTSLKFLYRKDSANECITVLSYKFSDASSWTEVGSSAATGVITHEFAIENPEGKTIDIQVKNISQVTELKWPTVDDWRLIALD